MLEGGGIYRLGEAEYPVQAGDFIGWIRSRSGSAPWERPRRSNLDLQGLGSASL